MATLTIRGLDDQLRDRLRVRAAQHGRSMEAEVRAILKDQLAESPPRLGVGSRIHVRFAALDGMKLDLPMRTKQPRPAAVDE
ncbi:Arc family DNA-binding protein [Lipingzhangella sp. LS1_29]|uniref:Arc family DNA-binding protein n=1 Tax=Lipingzhangella rawalii TaxID=2055835 RepID=A0ABU2H181_9ACTN|nr:Arc family DNA-binding protein [Lipingzhangella rawalii]MDS1269062.1 Arc family DNA-binding protein [Lipingzhangella rawalii]